MEVDIPESAPQWIYFFVIFLVCLLDWMDGEDK
jgi:hypothetical protein